VSSFAPLLDNIMRSLSCAVSDGTRAYTQPLPSAEALDYVVASRKRDSMIRARLLRLDLRLLHAAKYCFES
jgi:hypothetical protein